MVISTLLKPVFISYFGHFFNLSSINICFFENKKFQILKDETREMFFHQEKFIKITVTFDKCNVPGR